VTSREKENILLKNCTLIQIIQEDLWQAEDFHSTSPGAASIRYPRGMLAHEWMDGWTVMETCSNSQLFTDVPPLWLLRAPAWEVHTSM